MANTANGNTSNTNTSVSSNLNADIPHDFSKSEIKMAVEALFAQGGSLPEKLVNMVRTPFQASSARHMLAVIASEIWTVRSDLVRITFVPKHLWDGTPVTDFPKIGTHAYENAWEDKEDAERSEEIRDLMITNDLLERAAEHYAQIAQDEADEAGVKSQDGGRLNHLKADGTRINQKREANYVGSIDDWLVDQIASTSKTRARYLAQLEHLKENMPKRSHPDLQNAEAYCKELVHSDRLNKLGAKRWNKFVAAAVRFSEEQAAWDKLKAHTENEDAREEYRKAKWFFGQAQERFMSDWDIIAHVGVPTWLVNTPFWRTQVAYCKVEEANSFTQEVEAITAETVSKTARLVSQVKLANAQAASEAADAQLAELMARINASRAGATPAPTAPAVEEKKKEEVAAPATTAGVAPPRVITGRGRASASQLNRH